MKKCGLRRAYAAGGLLDENSFAKLVAQEAPLHPAQQAMNPAPNPYAGMNRLEVSQYTNDPDAINNARWASDPSGQSMIDDISRNSNLSGRQKASMMGSIGESMARMGQRADIGMPAGLSDMRKFGLRKQLMTNNNILDGIKGFARGGKVGVDQDGFIEGPGGVDNVPARIAETGEEIRVGAGERIVNKAQNAALEKLAAEAGMSLDDYLQHATGEKVGPTMKAGLRAAEHGWPVPYNPVTGQPVAPGGANLYAPRSTVPVQDGVRMGTRVEPSQARPNWIDPSKQVAPVYDASAQRPAGGGVAPAAAANVIEGQSTRVPNGSDRALVPTTGQTQFHDKITAEEMARGNQNRATGFREASEKAAAQATQAAQAAQTPPAQPKGGLRGAWGSAKNFVKEALTSPAFLAPLILEGGVKAINAIDSIPSLRGQATAHDFDMSLSDFDRQRAVEEDLKARDASWELRHGKSLGPSSPVKKPPVPSEKLPQGDPSYDHKEFARTKTGVQLNREALPPLASKSMDWLKSQGVNVDGLRRNIVTEQDFQRPVGAGELRQVNTAYGPVYAARGKNGQLNVTSGLDRSEAENDALQKASLQEARSQHQANLRSLDTLRRENARFNAFNDSITDPNVRASGLRELAMYGMQDKAAADARHQAAQLAFQERGQNIQLRGQENMQGNANREFEQKQKEANAKHLESLLDKLAPVTGLKDGDLKVAQQRRADLQEAMQYAMPQGMPNDPIEFQRVAPHVVRHAKATLALRDAIGRQTWVDKFFRNNGKSPVQTMQAIAPEAYDEKSDMLTLPGGYKIRGREIWADDADTRDAVLQRITLAQAKAQK